MRNATQYGGIKGLRRSSALAIHVITNGRRMRVPPDGGVWNTIIGINVSIWNSNGPVLVALSDTFALVFDSAV